MSSSRVNKSIKNVSYGLIIQAVTTLLNLASRIVLVRLLGRDVNGLNGLFTEVIAMLSLAEMGVGSAITYSLYKPLAENDEHRCSQLMWLFKQAYRVIAAVILLGGVVLTPFIQHLVKQTAFEISYIRVVFILFVVKTASSYLFSYKTSLLIADQKNYVASIITVICKAVMVLVNIGVLFATRNYLLFLTSTIAFTLITNVCISIYADKHYSFLSVSDRLPKEECKGIFTNIRHIFVNKLSSKITNSTDNILISVLVGTNTVGIYTNYAMLMTNIRLVFEQAMLSMIGGVGNLMVSEKPRHCSEVLKRLTFVFFCIGMVFGGGILCASEPFMNICFGEGFLLDNFTVFICAVNLYLCIWIRPLYNMVNVSGLFADDKKISIAGSAVNLIVSIILGKMIGIAGIFIGTICTYVIQVVLKTILLYRKKFDMSPMPYLGIMIKMLAITVVTILGEKAICDLIDLPSDIASFFIKGIISVAITAAVIIAFYGRSGEFKYLVSFIKTKIKSISNKIHHKTADSGSKGKDVIS